MNNPLIVPKGFVIVPECFAIVPEHSIILLKCFVIVPEYSVILPKCFVIVPECSVFLPEKFRNCSIYSLTFHFLCRKPSGLLLPDKYCRLSYTGLKNYYTLQQIACLINQFVEKGNFFLSPNHCFILSRLEK
ncbi:MAG: hypothetical protein LBG15_02415 [Dysgonamonadaceae bacterium]|nr:hypothetical protein [Dysgonamonadaceae bacterium]